LASACLVSAADHSKFASEIKTADPNLLAQFVEWAKQHERAYESGVEFAKRFLIFEENVARIAALNALEDDAEHRINQFADLAVDEFAAQYLGYKPSAIQHKLLKTVAPAPTTSLPASFDWRDHGAVTPVKNQGQCGSCWSFSTTGNVEGVNFLATGNLVSLSEQELVACETTDQGCGGGNPANAYPYIQKNGLDTEESYPYVDTMGASDTTCKAAQGKKGVSTIDGFVSVPTDETQIAAQLTTLGPLSVALNAAWMQFYFGGVSDPWICSSSSIDHAVLLVGYGTAPAGILSKAKDYWIIKNSWGESWGEKGYYRLKRGSGKCGVNLYVTSAVIKK